MIKVTHGNKTYLYDASYDGHRWYGTVYNEQGNRLHTTKAEYTTLQQAIKAAQEWIQKDLKGTGDEQD